MLQKAETEISNVKNSLAPEMMKQIFEIRTTCYANHSSEARFFKTENIRTDNYGIQSHIWGLKHGI